MPWNHDIIIYPSESLSLFSKEISIEEDEKLRKKIEEMIREIEITEKPFLYLAIGTANQSANQTNQSYSNFTTDDNIFMQQYPETFINNMKDKGYNPFILNIDSFSDKANSKLPIYFNGVFPLAGTVTRGRASNAIKEIKILLRMILDKKGKIFLLNAVADLETAKTNSSPYEFLMFKGIEELLSVPNHREMNNLIYASSYLQIRDYFNLYICTSKINSRLAYLANLNVSGAQLSFNNVFPG